MTADFGLRASGFGQKHIVHANFDCEARWSGTALPAHVMRRLRAIAPLLAALVDGPAEVIGPGDPPPHWDLAWADPDAKAANDRRLGLDIARGAGFALSGACVISSISDLPSARSPKPEARSPSWVCKAPWTSAGRDRVMADAPDAHARVAQLLARCGSLVCEPWLDRICDVAICGRVAGEHVELLPPHGLVTSSRGGFVGIDLDATTLEPAEHDQLQRAAHAAAAGLARAGYAGPFGVDAFAYRDGGTRRFHAMCEINARHTFGHVAHALAAKTGTRRLGFGAPPPGARVAIADPVVTAWVA